MNIGISFTSLLMSAHSKLVDLDSIEQVRTGCQRVHVIRGDSLVPMEVSWLNEELKHEHVEGIPREACEPEALATWDRFLEWFRRMDVGGKVEYSCGNYIDLTDRLVDEGHRVFYDGGWHTAPIHPMRRR